MPNFDQFIEFVLDTKRNLNKKPNELMVDPHLNFFWRQCDMCNIQYDVIGKAETSREDHEFIFTNVGGKISNIYKAINIQFRKMNEY